jgi:hypothetical protein
MLADEILAVSKKEIPENKRLDALPKYFGAQMMIFEGAVFDFMDRFCSDYTGGFWHFFSLDNGGFFMSPSSLEKEVSFSVDLNGFEGVMSNEAAGIACCLFAMSHLSFSDKTGNMAERYHELREFALDHQEAGLIFSAID